MIIFYIKLYKWLTIRRTHANITIQFRFHYFICEEVFLMKRKTYMMIASILMLLSFVSAYAEQGQHQKAESVVQNEIQSADSVNGGSTVLLMANHKS